MREAGERDLLARGHPAHRLEEPAVRGLAHGRRRPALAPDVHQVPPEEVVEGVKRVVAGRLRVAGHEPSDGSGGHERPRREDLHDHRLGGVRVPEGLQRVALGQPREVRRDELGEPFPVRAGDPCGEGLVHGETLRLPRGLRESPDERRRRLDGVPAVARGRFHRRDDRAPDDDTVRESRDGPDLLGRRDPEADGDGQPGHDPADARDERSEILRQRRAGPGDPAARHEIDEPAREGGRAAEPFVGRRRRERDRPGRAGRSSGPTRTRAPPPAEGPSRGPRPRRPPRARWANSASPMARIGFAYEKTTTGAVRPAALAAARRSSARASVTPAARARSEARWIVGPSASGSLNGMPSSITSAPAIASAGRRRPVVARSGSPASTKTTSAARPWPFARANTRASRVTGSRPRASRRTRRPCRRARRGSRRCSGPGGAEPPRSPRRPRAPSRGPG